MEKINTTYTTIRSKLSSILTPSPVSYQRIGFDADGVELDTVPSPSHNVLAKLSPSEYAVKERMLVRKIDRRLLPCLFAMIVLNYLDRNALANARVQGIEESLGLTGSEFNTAVSVLFVGYLALQIPSNMILPYTRPSIYLPACMMAWGVVSGLTAFQHGFRGLVTVRFCLGIVEAPYFPGALFLLSSWYTRKELALRTAILFSGSLLSGGFGGLVGAAVQAGLDDVHGIASWRWLFIIEASATVLTALAAMFLIPDFPHTTRFLTEEERAMATSRLRDIKGSRDTERDSIFAGFCMAVVDYKLWLLTAIILTKTSSGAVTSFIPTLVAGFGKGKVKSLLLIAPPYLFATVTALMVSYSSDRAVERSGHIIVPMLFATVGFIIASFTTNVAARYISLFLMLGGVYSGFNVALAWISSTLSRPVEKRSAAIAIINTIGNIAQIYSPYFYLEKNGPRYTSAMVANACFCMACIFFTLTLRHYLRRENRSLVAAESNANGPSVSSFKDEDADGPEARDIDLTVVSTAPFRYVI